MGIKVYVRAIVPTKDSYVLMGDTDKEGTETWDLPGGELKPGVDVKQYLRKLVLQNTGYTVTNIRFFEIVCNVRPRQRGFDPVTTFDFVFTTDLDLIEPQTPEKSIELLRHEKFEWLASDGRFRENKVMGLLGKYHHKKLAQHNSQLDVQPEATKAA